MVLWDGLGSGESDGNRHRKGPGNAGPTRVYVRVWIYLFMCVYTCLCAYIYIYIYTCVHMLFVYFVCGISWTGGVSDWVVSALRRQGLLALLSWSLKASIGSERQGDELRKGEGRVGRDPLLTVDIAAPGQAPQVCQRIQPGVSPKNSRLLGSRNVWERFPGTFSLHIGERVF